METKSALPEAMISSARSMLMMLPTVLMSRLGNSFLMAAA